MFDNSFGRLGLDNLLERDMTSYEFFHSLPEDLQEKVKLRDFCSFEDMSAFVAKHRGIR